MTEPDPAPEGPRIVQRGLYADELQIGATYEHRPGRTLGEADNVQFSTMTMNPQALHLDAAWSETTEFGQRLVNSMLTLATVVGASVAQITQGTLVANLGFGEISFPHPLHHGDTLYSETTVLGVRRSASRPGQAVVSLRHTGRNQHGDVVVRAARTTPMHGGPAPDQEDSCPPRTTPGRPAAARPAVSGTALRTATATRPTNPSRWDPRCCSAPGTAPTA